MGEAPAALGERRALVKGRSQRNGRQDGPRVRRAERTRKCSLQASPGGLVETERWAPPPAADSAGLEQLDNLHF